MNKRNIRLVQLSLLYFLLGGLLGVGILWIPQHLPGNPFRIHGHLMLEGFVTMMIFGVALHVLPRFSGRKLYSDAMADWQFWTVNVGLWLQCVGWLLADGTVWVAVGGVVTMVGVVLFGLNVALTMSRYQPVEAENLTGDLKREEQK